MQTVVAALSWTDVRTSYRMMGSKSWHVVAATAARALHISLEKPQGTKHVARSSRRPLPGALLSLYGDYPLRHNFGHVARAELARSLAARIRFGFCVYAMHSKL